MRKWKRYASGKGPQKLVVLLSHRYSADSLHEDALTGADARTIVLLEPLCRLHGFGIGLAGADCHVSRYSEDHGRSPFALKWEEGKGKHDGCTHSYDSGEGSGEDEEVEDEEDEDEGEGEEGDWEEDGERKTVKPIKLRFHNVAACKLTIEHFVGLDEKEVEEPVTCGLVELIPAKPTKAANIFERRPSFYLRKYKGLVDYVRFYLLCAMLY